MATQKTTTKKTTATTNKKAVPKKAPASSNTNTKPAKTTKPPAKKKLSMLDAAAVVLGNASEPLTSKQLIEQLAQQKLWTSPNGKTPHATLYAALVREINGKGEASRFSKVDKGLFALAQNGE
ncbi:winged helix-turn-helix domain-containing protein [Thalassoglobus neptunius]|nr:winged helix-turn-helix domain-containing protein [Thalassoglobus neptunius]